MKIQFLIAVNDRDYTEHLSKVLVDRYSDTFDVYVCTSLERIKDTFARQKIDVVLCDTTFAQTVQMLPAKQQLLLWDQSVQFAEEEQHVPYIYKYQRISSIVSEVLEQYAAVSAFGNQPGMAVGRITVVWSPCGGCGKTTVALAYAAQKAADDKKALYLNLENFASTPIYFSREGKSISRVFERIDGNLDVLLQSVRQQDRESGIYYFVRPDNYDDIHVLNEDDVAALAQNCAKTADEVIVDLSNACDEKTKRLFEIADTILIVLDHTGSSQCKWEQFRDQNSTMDRYAKKMLLVSNRGSKINDSTVAGVISLPIVCSDDPVVVYKTLSAGYFKGMDIV